MKCPFCKAELVGKHICANSYSRFLKKYSKNKETKVQKTENPDPE